jgi:hypothetical protein
MFKDIKYRLATDEYNNKLTITQYKDNKIETTFEKIRPFPNSDDWFENVWNEFIARTEKK